MAKSKKRDGGFTLLIVGGGLAVSLLLLPIPVWLSFAAFAVAFVAYMAFGSDKDGSVPGVGHAVVHRPDPSGATVAIQRGREQTSQNRPAPATSTASRSPTPLPVPRSAPAKLGRDLDELVSVLRTLAPIAPPTFRIPATPKGFGPAVWIPKGQSIQVAGFTIADGMVYVGNSLKAPGGDTDPCLIDPAKGVGAQSDPAATQIGYWPSYSEISPAERRGYLSWLAGGRSEPAADIGFVFLFFYGLERRVILDASKDPAVRADWPVIAQECRRLLGIYGAKSRSFNRHCNSLLSFVALVEHPEKLYNKPVPSLPWSDVLPVYLQLALGQAVADGMPIPAHLALAWVRLNPSIRLRTPATRCQAEFDALFAEHYAKAHGAGMTIPINRTKLKFVYRPASAGFRGFNELALSFGDIPDVTALTAPITMLQTISAGVAKELDAYSRFMGKNPDGRDALEGLLQLPSTLWPYSARKTVQALRARLGEGPVLMSFQDLLSTFQGETSLTKDRTLALARALESVDIGMEPDVLSGAKLPKLADRIVLFVTPPTDTASKAAPAFQAALLTLDVASAVTMVDGEFSVAEMSHLRAQVQSWIHLTPTQQRRLIAHLRLLMAEPVPLAALKKKLEPLPFPAKQSIAAFMAVLVQSDGDVSPAEVKMLEKVYKTLGLDAKKVFADVHSAAVGSSSVTAPASSKWSSVPASTSFELDPTRIAALQQDTAKVSALLAGIFREDEPSLPATAPEPEVEAEAEPAEVMGATGLLGLDASHSALVRMLLSRPQWSREELLDVAADLELMLDGALERINEACFDLHDAPLTEGEDPVEVNAEILEKIAE